ncbi:MAG: hypothetical protein ACRDK3_07090 [Actinomycetota bacterium]
MTACPRSGPLCESLGTIFGVTLPAFLVIAATHGWAGVRDLASRSVRWRVGIRWYLLGMPVAMTLAVARVQSVGAFVVEVTVALRGFDDLKRFLAAGSATGATAGTDE